MRILVVDNATYAITSREFTDEGFLKVPGRVARVGIQKYLASELGLKDRSPNEIVNVYRPPEEVFKDESLNSYDNSDITSDHPKEMVDASSFRNVSVGHAISGGRRDGDFVIVDLLIKDKEAIKEIEDGKVELSPGYTAEYVPSTGTFDGEYYEFIQKDIKINHVALVDKARAGNKAKIFDKHVENNPMKIVTLDKGLTVEIADDATAKLIQSSFDACVKRAEDAEEAKAKADEEKEKAIAEKEKMDEDMEKEKEKTSDAAINARLAKIVEVRDLAATVAGKDFTCDSLVVLDIQKAALAKARPSVDWSDKSESYIQAAWDMEVADSDENRARRTLDGLGKDLEGLDTNDASVIDKQYVTDDGKPVGDAAYDEFLSGGKK